MIKRFTLTLVILLTTSYLTAQIEVSTEYLSRQTYRDNERNKTDGKSGSITSSLSAKIPISIQPSEFMIPNTWTLAIGSSYTHLNNTKAAKVALPEDLLSLDVGVMHMRPMRKNMIFLLGSSTSIHSTHADFGRMRYYNFLFNAYAGLIWSFDNGIQVGFMVAATNLYKYPIVLPAPFFKWKKLYNHRWEIDVDFAMAAKISVGYIFSDKFKLSITQQPRLNTTFARVDGKDMLYQQAYIVAGIKPEFTFGKLTVPIETFARQITTQSLI